MDWLADLTSEQRQAVTHKDGPCLVIAGAGTGKTKVLTNRIAYLVKEGGVAADQILALTFTEKAATEMSERVDQLLPLGTNFATITTFHSFTTDLLRQYAHFLSLPGDFSLLTQEEELVFLREHWFDLPLNALRPGSNPTKFLAALLSFFNRLRDEDVDPNDIRNFTNTTLLDPDPAEQDEKAIYQELAAAYEKYEDLLRKEGYLTFGHCITETLHLLTERAAVKRELQRRYRYILVDEYQDTNWAQTELAIQLASENNNLMVVGDDDQAIYRFRGAAVSNLLAFAKRFPTARRLVLTNNFRSTQAILDTSYRMIQHNNPNRLEYQEKVDKRLKGLSAGTEPRFSYFDGLASELSAITKETQQWLDEGIEPQEIAILTRTRNQAAVIEQSLKNAGIAVSGQWGNDFYQEPLIEGVRAFLTLLLDQSDNLAFFNLFAHPPFKIEPVIFNKLLASRPYKEVSYFSHLREVLEQAPAWLPEPGKRRFEKAFALYEELSDKLVHRPSVVLLNYIHRSGLYAKLLRSKRPDAEYRLELLGQLFEQMQAFEERHRHALLGQFIGYLQILEDEGVTPNHKPESYDPFCVNVLTIHQSKGLEFSAVIVPHCVTGRFPSRHQTDKFVLPTPLIKEPLLEGDSHLQEERRLFYVAMTRAKKYLLCTAAMRYGDSNRKSSISPFIYEAFGDQASNPATQINISAKEYLQATLDLPENPLILPSVNNVPAWITISHTDLASYIECPRQYRYKSILRIKIYPSAALTFGISVHNALRAYFDRKAKGEKPNLTQLLEDYWISGGFETRSQEKERQREGKEALARLEDQLQTVQPEQLEWSFNFPLSTGDRLKGRIDRIDRLPDNKVAIVDYKTGRAKTLTEAKKDMQLGIYILAAEKQLKAEVKEVKLHYVMSDTVLAVPREEFALDTVTDTVQRAIGELKQDLSHDEFQPRPDKMRCEYCDYRRICPFRYTGNTT